MDVFSHSTVHGVRQVVVDDVENICNVQSTSHNTCSDHDGTLATSEGTDGVLTFALRAVAVNRSDRESLKWN